MYCKILVDVSGKSLVKLLIIIKSISVLLTVLDIKEEIWLLSSLITATISIFVLIVIPSASSVVIIMFRLSLIFLI